MKSLLKLDGDDFELWEEEKYGSTRYKIGIEGYMGFDKLEDLLSLYERYLEDLYKYLIENKCPKTERLTRGCIYSTRAIKVYYDHDYYWVFLDGYESTDIWDIYYYLEDVINQMKGVDTNQTQNNAEM